MLRVHIARGTSLSLTRRVDGPLCVPVDRDDRDLPWAWSLPWFVVPDEGGGAVLLHGEHHRPNARLGPGETFRHGDLAVRLADDPTTTPPPTPSSRSAAPRGSRCSSPTGGASRQVGVPGCSRQRSRERVLRTPGAL